MILRTSRNGIYCSSSQINYLVAKIPRFATEKQFLTRSIARNSEKIQIPSGVVAESPASIV